MPVRDDRVTILINGKIRSLDASNAVGSTAEAVALRRLPDAGLTMPGSSDSLGAQPKSLDPRLAICCSVARETYLVNRLAPEEAMTPLEARHTYTTAAAYADFEENRRGSIDPGKLVVLIVCDRGLLELLTPGLKGFRLVDTILMRRYRLRVTMAPVETTILSAGGTACRAPAPAMTPPVRTMRPPCVRHIQKSKGTE